MPPLTFLRFGDIIMGPGLLFTEGTHHKRQRKMLTPVFSGAHMRNLTPVFHGISNKVSDQHWSLVSESNKRLSSARGSPQGARFRRREGN